MSMNTYIAKEYAPDAPELLGSIGDKTTVRVIVLQDPHLAEPTSQYTQLLNGKHTEISYYDGIDPYNAGGWDLYVNMICGWSEIKGKGRTPWRNDIAHRILELMLEIYPGNLDQFDAGELTGKLKVSKERFRSLMTEVRTLTGKDILPDRYRSLSKHAVIIIERKG